MPTGFSYLRSFVGFVVKLNSDIFPEPSFSSNVVVWGSFSKIVRVNCFAILYSMLGIG